MVPKIIALALLSVLLGSASASAQGRSRDWRTSFQFTVDSPSNTNRLFATDPEPVSPCDDPLFKALQQKPLDSLPTREYEYFQKKDKECADYRRAVLIDKPSAHDVPQAAAPPSATEEPHKGMETGTAVLLGIVR